MKVKIGNKIYDAEDEPIMVILSDKDKGNINSMGKATKYCGFPEGWSEEDIVEFMKMEEK